MEDNKIPTVEDFLKSKDYNTYNEGQLKDSLLTNEVIKDIKEFTKLHVKVALERAAKEATLSYRQSDHKGFTFVATKESILNAYPEDNIK